MTDLRTAAQAVLNLIDRMPDGVDCDEYDATVEALRQALAEPVEPVGYVAQSSLDDLASGRVSGIQFGTYSERYDRVKPLYTTPPSVDALIAMIDDLSPSNVNDEYGCNYSEPLIMYHACDIKAILNKYRGQK